MSPLLAILLVSHVVLGIIGLGAIHLAFMHIIRREPPWGVVTTALWVSVAGLFLSWASGAYYYVIHYGSAVKPRILESGYPWAHQVFMESKEHVFLMVPFLAITSILSVYAMRLNPNPSLKSATSALLAVALILGTFVAVSGVLVSGAVR